MRKLYPYVDYVLEDKGYKTLCHIWLKYTSKGYAVVSHHGKNRYVHILIWLEKFKYVPDGKELYHLCNNKNCINVEHLEPVIHKDNVQSVWDRGQIHHRKLLTHCKHGHELTKENTYLNSKNNTRHCKQCVLDRNRLYKFLKG